MKNTLKFAYSLLIVALTAYISSYFTQYGINAWYHRTVKSIFTPPDSFFPVIWGILYFMLAVAFYVILLFPNRRETLEARQLFLSQLIMQAVWCFVFFHQGQLGLGLLFIIFMGWLAWKMLKSFAAVNSKTAWLLYPYLGWLAYASFLNLLFVVNNGFIVEF